MLQIYPTRRSIQTEVQLHVGLVQTIVFFYNLNPMLIKYYFLQIIFLIDKQRKCHEMI